MHRLAVNVSPIMGVMSFSPHEVKMRSPIFSVKLLLNSLTRSRVPIVMSEVLIRQHSVPLTLVAMVILSMSMPSALTNWPVITAPSNELPRGSPAS